MQSRRHEDYMAISSAMKLRNQRRIETGHGPYAISRHDAPDRSPRARRSLSPRKQEGSRRVLVGEQRSSSVERRDYGGHSGANRTDKTRSRSPPYGQLQKRPHFEEGVVHRKYEYTESMDFDADTKSRLKHVYGYDHGPSRTCKEEYTENNILGVDGHGILGQKSMTIEDGTTRGSFRLAPDMGPTSNYVETGRHAPSSSRSIDISRFEHEKLRYRESMNSDKLSMMEPYKEGEKPMFHSRDVSYTMLPASHAKDFASTAQFKEFAGTSSGVSRSEVLGPYDGVLLPASDEYPRSSGKLTEPVSVNAYCERPLVDSGRDVEAGRRNMTLYQRGAYNSTRAEHEDNLYLKPREIVNDNRGYPSDDLHRIMPPRAPVDYDHNRMDYDHRDLSRPSVMHPVADRIDNTEDSCGNPRKNIIWDHSTLQKQKISDYLDMSRTSHASKEGREYLGPGCTDVEFRRRLPRDYETSHLGLSQDRLISHFKSDYGFGRDAGTDERLQNRPMLIYDSEMHRHAVRTQKMKEEELDIYEPSVKMLKRKYIIEEGLNRHDSRTIMSSKWNVPTEFEDLYDSGEEWIDEEISGSRTGRFNHNEYRKAKRTYDGRDHPSDFSSDEWLPSQGSLAHAQRHSVKFYKHGSRYTKGHPRPVSLSWYNNSYHTGRRGGLHKQHKVWKRNDDYDGDVHANDDDTSEDWVNVAESEPSEDSEEFKQLVHEAFLEYSKKLNVNSSVRRRYKEQGKAGSLFCIVCGRSSSKDFMDTQRLVTHAFMSHKVGLRAQHLGLHKAICVLLGWNSVAPCDTITWVPEPLPDAEVLAQKEDLILWPPLVVIHNVSMSNNNPKEQKVIPIEVLEAFLRGKGFVGGKIKVCLGKPADQSIMVVKFLGTFSGLGNAEKIHKYFTENNRGRLDFERMTSNNGRSIKSGEAEAQGDKVERLLYGYMGIAEDLDRVDFNTKKWIMIKSKNEIQDLANDPVKPEER